MALMHFRPTQEEQTREFLRQVETRTPLLDQGRGVVCVLEGEHTPLCSSGSLQCTPHELQAAQQLFANREQSIRRGFHLGGKRYEVYQHYEHYVTGRCMQDGNKDAFVCVKMHNKLDGRPVFTVALFSLPLTSTEIIPPLLQACDEVFSQLILRNFYL